MRLPVEDWDRWYNAQKFGVKTDYGYHEGDDINLKTGGDTDLGQPIYAISSGEVTSVHSHTGKPTFGKHTHVKHEGPWGVVWCHYAHCNEIFVKEGDQVLEGQRIATVGKTGTGFAHLHWAIKLQPTGVDAIAKTLDDLSKWTNPTEFVLEWSRKTNANMDWLKNYFNEHFGIDLTKPEGEVRSQLQPVVDAYKKVNEYEKRIQALEKDLAGKAGEIGELEQRLQAVEQARERLKDEVDEKNQTISEREATIFQLQKQLQDIEGKVCIPQEDYDRLTAKKTLDKFTGWELVSEIFRRAIRK